MAAAAARLVGQSERTRPSAMGSPWRASAVRYPSSRADEVGIDLYRGLRFRNATDGVVALRAGYPCASIASVDEFKVPTEYHWPTDTADRVDYARVADAARLCLRLVRRLERHDDRAEPRASSEGAAAPA